MNKSMLLCSAIFWSSMIVLSLSARTIHNNRLPYAETLTVNKQDFICTFADENGNMLSVTRRAAGLPKNLNFHEIYVIMQEEVYGEIRYYAQRKDVMLYENYDSEEYLAVMYGVSAGDILIVSADRPLEDHIEVYYDGQ